MAKQKIILVDGFALIFKAYYAFINNPLKTSQGKPTSILFGFMRMLMKVIKELSPDYLVVALESKEKTFRSKIYPEYKANRSAPPDDLTIQIPWLISLLEKFDIPCVSASGYEADDVIATLATEYKSNKQVDVYILSSDKDLMQLVGENVKCITSSRGVTDIQVLDAPGVKEKIGVMPDRILEFLALTGDTADNIPGIKGVGKKTAAKLLDQFESIDEMYEHLDRIKGKIKDNIARGREDIKISKQLLRLETNLDIEKDLLKFKLPNFNNENGIEYIKEFELQSLLKDDLFKGIDNSSQKPVKQKTYIKEEKQFSRKPAEKGTYKAILTKSEIHDLVKKINEKSILCIDTETTNENPILADLIGVSFSFEDKKAYYIPYNHVDGKNFDNKYLIEQLKTLLENPEIKLIGQNIKYDYIVLKKYGIKMSNVFFDTIVASYVLDSTRPKHNLDFLAEYFLNYQTIKYSELVDTKKGETLLDVDFERVVDYASEDADITFRLYKLFEKQIDENNLGQVFYSIDMPLVKILAEIEYNGVLINVDQMNKMSGDFEKRINEIKEQVFEYSGYEFNVNSTQQLSKLLFEELNLPPKKKTKTGFSTDNQVLEELKGEHPIIENIIEYRKITKIKNTYLDALPPMINEQTKRIHATFNQTITATGRLSSSNPNLQNIPIRGETGSEIRQCFIPADGYKIMSADYSQIELRILAHVTDDEMLVNAYKNNKDIHTQTAALIYNTDEKSINPEMRSAAKTINFAVIYGRGARNLSKDLKITVQQAQEFRDKYFEKYSRVRDYIELVKDKSSEAGFVRTLFGRIRYLEGYSSSNKRDIAQAERVAFNTIIQGTSADIIKIAMKNICGKFQEQNLKSKMLIQVHDELVFEALESEIETVKKIVTQEMENAVELNVPLNVNAGIGENWDEAH